MIWVEMLDGWEDVERVVYYQDLSNISKIIRIKMTSQSTIKKLENMLPKNGIVNLQLLLIPIPS